MKDKKVGRTIAPEHLTLEKAWMGPGMDSPDVYVVLWAPAMAQW